METKKERSGKAKIVWIIAAIAMVVALIIGCCVSFMLSDRFGARNDDGKLAARLAAEGTDVIELTENVIVKEPLVVNGSKTITGTGKILLDAEIEAQWPSSTNPGWGVGCPALDAEDASGLPAVLTVSDGASLTLSGSAGINAEGNFNGILLQGSAALTVTEDALVENGRYGNLIVGENAVADIRGGCMRSGGGHNFINYGTVTVSGGTVEGAASGAALYNAGTATQSGGTISNSNMHNVYVASGSFTMTGGVNDGAAKDGIVVAEGAEAQVTGGRISNCIHGLCNNGTLGAGEVTLNECGIMNYGTGTLNLEKTTVDTSEVYCLANNGGKVAANFFTAIGCDTCAVYNFSGDMELNDLTVQGSRDANISTTGGNLTVNTATLGLCRDKSVVVGNGTAVFNNVAILGTSNEKYGVYAFGGDTYLNDCTIENVSSTAVKLDAGSTVHLKNVNIQDAAQNGFQVDGGLIDGENVTMTNMGSHGIYNKNGDVSVKGITITDVAKNAIQQVGGMTTLEDLTAVKTGNHGAYVEAGTLTLTDSSLTDMPNNGMYIVAGDSKVILSNVSITRAGQQGIHNSSVVEGTKVCISDTGNNGIYNKAGTMTLTDSEIRDTREHGINNKQTITLVRVTVSGAGDGSNGIQNNGAMTVQDVSVSGSGKHGLYNNGVLTGTGLTIDGTGDNGLYNDRGTATLDGLEISNTAAQGINSNSTLKVTDVKIEATGKNGIYISEGTAVAEGLTVSGAGEHGVSNAGTLTLTDARIDGSAPGSNGIQNSGTLTVNGIQILSARNHGVYNTGTLSGQGLTVSGTAGNGIYNDGGTVKELTDVAISDAKDQGVNNTGAFSAGHVTISKTGKNGVYNNGGTADFSNLTVESAGEHGVSNAGTMTLTDSRINGSGRGSNCIQNSGSMTLSDVVLSGSSNHGIYNSGTLASGGALTIAAPAVNGLYNYGGDASLAQISISASGEYGINNAGTLEVGTAEIRDAVANGIQNSGSMTVSGSASVTDSGKHGIYNSGSFRGQNITVTNAYDLLASNTGRMIIDKLVLSGTAHKALYNTGYGELCGATIDGTGVTNGGSSEYLVDNNGGILDLVNTTVCNAFGTALHNRGNATSLTTNVIIDGAGNYGIFIEAGSTLSGNGLVVNNITREAEISDAEGYAIKNQGCVTMMDHVTLGAYDDNVTGDGVTARKETGGIASTALTNDSAGSTYSGSKLVIRSAENGNAVYNKGTMFLRDPDIDGARDGLVTRYTGWVTLSGNVSVTNITRNPISVYGPESGSYVNGVTLVDGADMYIDTAGGHAINNKGSFLAAANTTLTVRNIAGQNINAINNQTGAVMTLGNVTVDGVYVTVTLYDTAINTNSGNGIQNNAEMEINGSVLIQNIFTQTADGSTDNSVGSGLIVKNGGKITGAGSITIIGNQSIPDAYAGFAGMFNGIYADNGTVELGGDILVGNVVNQGIYLANETGGAAVSGDDITVTNVAKGNGIYIRFKTGRLIATGDVTVSAVGQNGITNAGQCNVGGDLTVRDISTGYNGLRVDGTGNTAVTGNVNIRSISGTTTGTNAGNALHCNGKLTVNGDVTISNVTTSGNTDNTSNNGINGTGTITVGGNLTIADGIKAGHGIFLDKGKLLVTGTITINGSGSGKQGLYLANANAAAEAGNVIIKNTGGNGIYINNASGKMTVSGSISIDTTAQHGLNNVGTVSAASLTIQNAASGYNGIEAKSGSTLTVDGAISVANVGKRGLNNAGTVNAASLTIAGFAENGIQNTGTLTVSGAIDIRSGTGGHGIYNSGTVKGGSLTISGVTKNGINNAGTMNITGEIAVSNAVAAGVANSKTLTAGSVTVDTVTGGNGLHNSGSFTVTGAASVSNITKAGTYTVNNSKTMSLGALTIDGVAIPAIETPNSYGVNNTGTITLTGIQTAAGAAASAAEGN